MRVKVQHMTRAPHPEDTRDLGKTLTLLLPPFGSSVLEPNLAKKKRKTIFVYEFFKSNKVVPSVFFLKLAYNRCG